MAFLDLKRPNTVGVEDLVLLSQLNDKAITENLKIRFAKDLIYTNIGQVLISVNPFKRIQGIYSDERIQHFRTHGKTTTTPHVFALAEDTYRTMILEEEHQCVIISGESGAGKTEASKQIMQYVAAVSGNSKEMQRVKEIILESNPLLESFGNAKTVRNDNSSRFGKFFEIYFDRVGGPVGGKMSNFLLEKTRVVGQQKGERNFHIFYQFCAGGEENRSLKDKYHLKKAAEFYYLTSGNTLDRAGVSDLQEWKETLVAMDAIGISKDDQDGIFLMLATILHLGEIQFKHIGGDSDECTVTTKDSLRIVADMLGIDEETLNSAILWKRLEIGGEVVNVAQDMQMCANTRDAIAKAIYDKLFDFIVESVNIAFGKNDYALMLGVLDIYGFEIFEKNGFEQFCINYVNEKLQQIFIELTLKVEQEEYVRENIPWEEIKYFNNKVVCDLVEGMQPPGLFAIIDDVCAAMSKEKESVADIKMLNNLDGVHCGNPHFKRSDRGFMIRHYAGDVHYDAAGFINRNKDTLNNDVLIALATAKNRFFSMLLGDLLNDALSEGESGRTKKRVTAGSRIRQQAAALVNTLKKCNPHYVRTIKSNDMKSPNLIDESRVAHQCKYLGLLENIRVRRAGYSYRQYFDKFLKRFKYTCPATFPRPFKGSDKDACLAVLMNAHATVPKDCWQLGTTKVFIRHPQNIFALEDLREGTFGTIVSKIQRAWGKYRNNKEYILLKANNDRIYSKANKQRRADSVFRPFQGDYLKYRSELTHFHPLVDYDPIGDAWKEYWGEGGKRYHYNYITQKAVWDRPAEMDKNHRVFFSEKVNRIINFDKALMELETMILTDRAIYFMATVYETIITPPTKPTKKDPRPPPPPAPYQISRHILKKRLDIRLLSGVSLSALADTVAVAHFYQAPVPYRTITLLPLKGCTNCMMCGVKLTPAAKKANCPGCGIVCCMKTCLTVSRPLPTLGYPKPVSVCFNCVNGEPMEAQEDIVILSPLKSEIVSMIRKVYKKVMGSGIPININNSIQAQLAFEKQPRNISFQLSTSSVDTQVLPGITIQSPPGIDQAKIAEISVRRDERRKVIMERYKKEQEEQRLKEIQKEKEREEAHRKMVEDRKRARREADEKEERERAERQKAALNRRNVSSK